MATQDQVTPPQPHQVKLSITHTSGCVGCVFHDAEGSCNDQFSALGKAADAAEKHHGDDCCNWGSTENMIWILKEA